MQTRRTHAQKLNFRAKHSVLFIGVKPYVMLSLRNSTHCLYLYVTFRPPHSLHPFHPVPTIRILSLDFN